MNNPNKPEYRFIAALMYVTFQQFTLDQQEDFPYARQLFDAMHGQLSKPHVNVSL